MMRVPAEGWDSINNSPPTRSSRSRMPIRPNPKPFPPPSGALGSKPSPESNTDTRISPDSPASLTWAAQVPLCFTMLVSDS